MEKRAVAVEAISLFVGMASAMAASACCLLPAILVSLGIGGAWLSELKSLERFFPVFVGIAAAAFAFAFYRIYVRPAQYEPGSTCATRRTSVHQRTALWVALLFAAALVAVPFLP
jgi:mercuric ion transport protein